MGLVVSVAGTRQAGPGYSLTPELAGVKHKMRPGHKRTHKNDHPDQEGLPGVQ